MERRKLLGHERGIRLRTVRKALYQQVSEKVHPGLFQPLPGRNKFVQGFQIAGLSAYAIRAIHLNSGHRFLIGLLFQRPDRAGQVFFYSCNFFTILVTKSEISATYAAAQNFPQSGRLINHRFKKTGRFGTNYAFFIFISDADKKGKDRKWTRR